VPFAVDKERKLREDFIGARLNDDIHVIRYHTAIQPS